MNKQDQARVEQPQTIDELKQEVTQLKDIVRSHASGASKAIRTHVSEASSEARVPLNQAKATLSSAARGLGSQLRTFYDDRKVQMVSARSQGEDYIRHKPLQAGGIALLVGGLVPLLFKRK